MEWLRLEGRMGETRQTKELVQLWAKYLDVHKWEHLTPLTHHNGEQNQPVLHLNARDFAYSFHFPCTVLKML